MTNGSSEYREGGGVYPVGDWAGVPVQFGAEFVINVLNDWGRRIAEGAVSSELMDEIKAGFAERESVFPHAPLWDRSRTVLAGDLFDRGFVNESIGLLRDIYSLHVMVHAALDLGSRQNGRYGDIIVSSLMQHVQNDPDQERMLSFIQAMIDTQIAEDPYDPQIDMFEGMLRMRDHSYDPVQAWANSQQVRDPDANWNEMPALIRNESLWAEVPIRYRQYAIMRYFDMIQALRDELSTEAVLTIVEAVQQMEEEYPEARIWDELRTAYVSLLLESGYPAFAIDFAKATKRADYQKAQIVAFISKGAEDEAFELTTSLADPAAMAEVLLEGEWSNDRGLLRLAEIIEDDNYLAEQRLTCLVFVRNRMAANGESEMLARYDAQIEQLRVQIADKKSAE